MPPYTVSCDLKARIPVLALKGYSVQKICSLLGIKKSLVYQTLKYHRVYGVPHNLHRRKPGRPRVLSPQDLKFVVSLLKQRHTIYLDEIQEELQSRRQTSVSLPTIMRALHRMDFTHKVISAGAIERNDLLRAVYMNRIADEVPDPNMLMFIDESARNRRSSPRNMGWSRTGLRCVQRRFFVRGQRYSLVPVLTLDGIITYDIMPGSVTSARFLQFLRELVVSVTPPTLNMTNRFRFH